MTSKIYISGRPENPSDCVEVDNRAFTAIRRDLDRRGVLPMTSRVVAFAPELLENIDSGSTGKIHGRNIGLEHIRGIGPKRARLLREAVAKAKSK